MGLGTFLLLVLAGGVVFAVVVAVLLVGVQSSTVDEYAKRAEEDEL